MLKAISGILLLAMLASVSLAEDFILRFEHGSYQKEDRPGGVLDSLSDQIQLVTSEGVVNELLEVQIRTGERFYTKARFGSTAVEIRGELKAPDDTGKQLITIRSRVTEFTGELTTTDGKIVEDSNSMSSSTSLYITVGEPLWIGNVGLSPKPKGIVPSARTLEHNIMFVTLEPAKNEILD